MQISVADKGNFQDGQSGKVANEETYGGKLSHCAMLEGGIP